ncbi:MAG: OmpA family protein [Flavobacteriales bacterium]|nr:OmpA family protein [Flavobacteriales bacterium]
MTYQHILCATCALLFVYCSRAQGDVSQALATHASFANATTSIDATALLGEAVQLRSQGKYAQADKTLEAFGLVAPSDSRAWRQANSAARIPQLLDPQRAACTLIGINLPWRGVQGLLSIHGQELLLSVDPVYKAGRADAAHAGKNGATCEIRSALVATDGTLQAFHPEHAINSRQDERAVCYSPDGRQAYITRLIGPDRLAQLFVRTLADGNWSTDVPFAWNAHGSHTGWASIATNGQQLWFASDRPGGFGGSDLWYCQRGADGGWNTPMNAGGMVNTEGEETHPFISTLGDLCFASDGHLGLGGLDLFAAHLRPDGLPGRPRNPGAPLNSLLNETGLVLDSTGRKGYMARERTTGEQEVFAIWFNRSLAFEGQLGVDVRDRRNSQQVPAASISLLDADGLALTHDRTTTDGRGIIEVDPAEDLLVEAALEGYRAITVPVEQLRSGSATVLLPWLQEVVLWLHVENSLTGTPLDSAIIKITEVVGNTVPVAQQPTDGQGDFRTSLYDRAIGDSLVLRIAMNKPGFYPKKGLFMYKVNEYGEVPVHQKMDPAFLEVKQIRIGDDIAKEIRIKPIFFEPGSATVAPLAMAALDQIAEVLVENPYMVVVVASHTDSRGNAASNARLSQRRAKATAAYIAGKGIAPGRLITKGHGEAKLANACADGTQCSDEQHAANRRTEFIVLDL